IPDTVYTVKMDEVRNADRLVRGTLLRVRSEVRFFGKRQEFVMKTNRGFAWVAGLFFVLTALVSGRAEALETEHVRENKPIGAYASLWGDPYPALYGVNLAYNVYDFVRINGGVGTNNTDTKRATIFGAGVKLLVPG